LEPVGGKWSVVHRALGPDLYTGTSGISLFLAHLHRLTGEKLFRTTAEGAIRQATSRLTDVGTPMRPGFYAGLMGIAHALLRVGEILGDEVGVDEAVRIAAALEKDDLREQGLDLMTGSAGAIVGLLSLYGRRPDDFLLALAIRHGKRLIATARKSPAGLSWDTLPGQTRQDLTGFSHGTAGIASALFELYRVTGDADLRGAAVRALDYERHCFSHEHQNWPDFRNLGPQGTGAPTFPIAWCHGAAGIGFSRLRAYQITDDPTCREEAETALQTTTKMLAQARSGTLSDASLCHGVFGNAELLTYAAHAHGEPDSRSLVGELGRLGIERYLKDNMPWPCGVPGGGETPHLMLGLAGIGYFYLRLHDPDRVPCILIVAPDQRG